MTVLRNLGATLLGAALLIPLSYLFIKHEAVACELVAFSFFVVFAAATCWLVGHNLLGLFHL